MANVYTKVLGRYVQAVEAVAIADSDGANVVTVNGAGLSRHMKISGNIIPVKVTVTETSAGDGAYDVRLEGSLDVDFTTKTIVDASAGINVDPTGTNSASGVLVATGYHFPYWRVVLFTDGTDTVDAAAATVTVVAPFDNSLPTPLRRVALADEA